MTKSVLSGYILYESGYDVWMGNARGNRYSRKHRTYHTKWSKFWDFSVHEIGKNDLPVLIDRVLNETGFQKLHYIGHSQGSAAFWILCSERPEYNAKVMLAQAVGPVAYVKHSRSPIVIVVSYFLGSVKIVLRLIGMNEFMPSSELITLIGNLFCKDGAITQAICTNIIFFVTGFNKNQMNETMLPVVSGHAPAGSSTRQIIHFAQLKNSGEFRQYDHGIIQNIITYRSFKPPSYNLSKVKVKVALHYSLNDWLADPKDVDRLHQELPNSIGKFLVEDKNFNHLDFLWGINAKELLFERMIEIMKNVERESYLM